MTRTSRFRVLAAQQQPDHATIARFVERHEHAIAGLFGEVLTLICAGVRVKRAMVLFVVDVQRARRRVGAVEGRGVVRAGARA